MTWIMSLLTILTMWLAGNKSVWAWVVGLGNQILWATYIVQRQEWGLALMWGAIVLTYTRNLRKWQLEATKND